MSALIDLVKRVGEKRYNARLPCNGVISLPDATSYDIFFEKL